MARLTKRQREYRRFDGLVDNGMQDRIAEDQEVRRTEVRRSDDRMDDFHEAIPAPMQSTYIEREVERDRPVGLTYDRDSTAAAAISWIVGAIETLLGLRLLLRFLGASTNSQIVRIIYDLSYPLIRPFAGVFGFDATTVGISGAAFEVTTLVAMVFYALIGYLAVSLIRTIQAR